MPKPQNKAKGRKPNKDKAFRKPSKTGHSEKQNLRQPLADTRRSTMGPSLASPQPTKRIPRPGFTFDPSSISPQLGEYEAKMTGIYSPLRLSRFTNTINFTTDLANIKTHILDRLFIELEAGSTIDKYDNDYFVDLEEYTMYWAELIVELGLQQFQVKTVPSLTRGNSTQGLSFDRETMVALYEWLETYSTEIPIVAVALARLYLIAIQTYTLHEDSGATECYIMLLKPNHTLATLKTLMANIDGEYAKAKAHMNRLQLKTVKFSRDLLEMQIVSAHSQIGDLLMQMWPSSDDSAIAAGTEYIAMDATYNFYCNADLGIGEIVEALCAYRVANDSANGPYFLSTIASAAAGKLSIEYVAVGGTAFTAYDDTDGIKRFFRTTCATQAVEFITIYSGRYGKSRVAGAIWPAATDFAIYLYRYLLRKQRLGEWMPRNSGFIPCDDRIAGSRLPRNSGMPRSGVPPADHVPTNPVNPGSVATSTSSTTVITGATFNPNSTHGHVNNTGASGTWTHSSFNPNSTHGREHSSGNNGDVMYVMNSGGGHRVSGPTW